MITVTHFPSPPLLLRLRRNRRPSAIFSGVGGGGGGGGSYLELWKSAVERERRSQNFESITKNTEKRQSGDAEDTSSLDEKTERFKKLLEFPREERDRIQRMQVIDRAAAAIAAARAIVKERPLGLSVGSAGEEDEVGGWRGGNYGSDNRKEQSGLQFHDSLAYQSVSVVKATPGPDFWTWAPPSDGEAVTRDGDPGLMPAPSLSSHSFPSREVIEKEKVVELLSIPFESSILDGKHNAPLPPLQSFLEVDKVKTDAIPELSAAAEEDKLEVLFSGHAAEVAETLKNCDEASSYGVKPDGSKWWKETGVEERPNGVVCKWTLIRGVSVDGSVEWEDKFWEAADQFDYKELGSEKSGRDAWGNVWREYWKESMWQDMKSGLLHIEKMADKWGKNGKGDEWQEKWLEHYDASGKAEKWAHKWCSIDPNTPLEVGHAHVWHERWGEQYDGYGGSTKYTDKWAERSEGDGWSKWGDKWDEHFDSNGHGVKQGETWWEGKHGERWNRTWGEKHNGTGWLHKYGRSSSGEHWDTHVQEETWYERYPHYDFKHSFQNSVQLRGVRKPPHIL